MCFVQGIARYLCLKLAWKTESQFSNSNTHLPFSSLSLLTVTFLFSLSLSFSAGIGIFSNKQSGLRRRLEAAVSGLEFTGNNIVSKRWSKSECTCHDKVSRRCDASVQLLNCQSQFEVRRIRCDFSASDFPFPS